MAVCTNAVFFYKIGHNSTTNNREKEIINLIFLSTLLRVEKGQFIDLINLTTGYTC